MTPVPKSGDRLIVNDYHSVSVIPVIAKVPLCTICYMATWRNMGF